MSTNYTPRWAPPSEPPPDDAVTIPIALPSLSSTTSTVVAMNGNQGYNNNNNSADVKYSLDLGSGPNSHPNPHSPPSSPGATPKYPMYSYTHPGPNRVPGSMASPPNGLRQGQNDGNGGPLSSEAPTGTPLCIIRVSRDHNNADEATRFECEQFPEEFLGRMTRAQFKSSVEGINACMEDAERPLLNCLDTLLDCLTAYTAKHCCGTHYQRAIRRMEEYIDQENRRLYHPARMHLRDPQKVGMIYLEFELH
ncbi:hypothetical protein EMPS_07063 [Entomortierella parvispora]|uniref:Ras modification protein ERF4 n=1 Tax=Entomortierella parvispora TaxID=205924 RepID=A0A9P3HDT6_9FUNG|nr:hypothetical protein EMPS_07063 [Entomortierella parvispora]